MLVIYKLFFQPSRPLWRVVISAHCPATKRWSKVDFLSSTFFFSSSEHGLPSKIHSRIVKMTQLLGASSVSRSGDMPWRHVCRLVGLTSLSVALQCCWMGNNTIIQSSRKKISLSRLAWEFPGLFSVCYFFFFLEPRIKRVQLRKTVLWKYLIDSYTR